MEVSYVSKKPTMAKQQQSVTVTTRPPLVPSEKNNPVAGRTRTMEVSSRYRSPTPTKTRRCPSPIIVTRTASPSSQSPSKRAVSAERKRSSSTPTTPTYPSTPVSDVSSDLLSRRLSSGRLPESLWPSTMRSLSVSFQSDSVSVKKVKPFVTSPNDRTLRPPSNIAYVTSPNDRTLRPPSNIAYVTSPNDRTLRPHSNIAYVTSPNDRTLRPHIASVTSPNDRALRPSSNIASVTSPNDRALRPSSNIASVTSPNDRTLRPSSNIASVTSPNDRTLRPSSNIAYKQQGETTSVSRKHTPERKRSPLKNVSGQSENSKPVNGPHSRIIEQHQWPSRISETITSNAMSISLDLGDKAVRRMSLPLSKGSKPLQKPPVRRMSLPLSKSSKPLQKPSVRRMTLHLSKIPKPLHKSSSDAARFLSCYENGGLLMSPTNSEDGNSLTWSSSESLRLSSPTSLDGTAIPRFQSAPGSRAASPSRTSLSSSLSSSSSSNSRGMSPSRGVSPLRGLSPSRGTNVTCLRLPTPPPSPSRGANVTCLRSPTPPPSPSRGANVTCLRLPTPPPSPSRGPNLTCLRSPTAPPSPSRIRQTNKSAQSTSVLSFFADVKKGKKATYIEDVHQLRLLYNRYSQWRFANARAEGVRYIQRLIAEETLYNVWHATSDLRDLVTAQRICLQQLKLEIKLESILNYQMVCLDDWGILEREHISSLAGAIGDLEANTLRLSLTGGTKADLGSLKLAMSSALDVMEAMGSSILSLHSQMEETTKLVSDLSVIATEENFMLDKCEDLLASTSVMEIEERSLMTHLIQKKQEEEVRGDAESPLLPLSKFSWS